MARVAVLHFVYHSVRTEMHSRRLPLFSLTLAAMTCASAGLQHPRSLLLDSSLKPSSADVTVSRSDTGLTYEVRIAAGKDAYPGVNVTPKSGPWDLSKVGHVEAVIANIGPNPVNVGLRVDNAGNWQDNPWNTESVYLAPGQSGKVTTIFGYSYGHKKGFELNPKAVVNLVLFTTKSDYSQAFRIESLVAGGLPNEDPPIAPDDVRIRPQSGDLLKGAISYSGAVTSSPNPTALGGSQYTLTFDGTPGRDVARVSPLVGRWDLSGFTRLRVKLANLGSDSTTPRVRIDSNGGSSDWREASEPIKPHGQGEVVVEFAHPVDVSQLPLQGLITSDAVSGVAVSVAASPKTQRLAVVSMVAELPVATLPAWVGKQPPVPGDWIKTLDEEFSGKSLNRAVWRDVGENYYDKVSHWSKDNVLLERGLAKLRFAKKTGFQNDDPKRNSTAYASGYLDTYGLWTQRYGYFESRMKVPEAPGLWPAFWMMPDRGTSVGPEQWKRQDTANGGMEFDIMEHLSRWGSHRFNIAMHYDGYEKDHKQIGSDKIYVEPDKDGFITCGLLWEPGLLVYYYNGHEVLRWKNPRVSNVPAILMFTLPMGGWDNNALDDRTLPADFAIDYVRVWQLKGLR